MALHDDIAPVLTQRGACA